MLPPTCIWMNFKKSVFVYQQAVSLFCETYPFIVVKAIKSNNVILESHYIICKQSLLKNLGGGQDKPAGIGCPPPIIEGILSD